MKRIISIIIIGMTILLVGCSREKMFKISGNVSDAGDQKLYLEHMALDGTKTIDSVVLQDNGKFAFKHPVPEYPDFYRLRLGQQTIPFPIDTVEHIVVTADAQNFATSYNIEGSETAKQMKEIWLAQLDANVKVSGLIARYNQGQITINDYTEHLQEAISDYKRIANKYIFNNPKSSVSYFALFQQVGGALLYNIYDKQDSRCFAVVANVYEAIYPESTRTKHLYELALKSVSVVRAQERRERALAKRDSIGGIAPEIKVIGYVDITLPDINGDSITLSEIAKDCNTLLSFTSMAAGWTAQYNAELSNIYDVYGSKGLRIYQVGFDMDSHVWKTVAARLPWTNVRDKDGKYSQLVGYYNLSYLPALFIINKDGEIERRFSSFEEINRWLSVNMK